MRIINIEEKMPTTISYTCALPRHNLRPLSDDTVVNIDVKKKPTSLQCSIRSGSLLGNMNIMLSHRTFDDVIGHTFLKHHLHDIHLLRYKNGKRAILKCLPSSSKPIMRLERDVIQNEIVVYTHARAMHLPIPKIITYEDRVGTSCKPYLATGLIEGISYANILSGLSGPQKDTIERQMKSFAYTLRGHRSSVFGSVAEVAKGEGYKTWAEMFGHMFETILMDGEDMLVGLPYTHLREQLGRFQAELNQVEAATLVLPGLWAPKNILVDPSRATVSGILDLGCMAMWGDVDFMGPHYAMKPKSLLYACFHAVMTIVRHHYRPRDWQSRSELDAWRNLNESLRALMRMDH